MSSSKKDQDFTPTPLQRSIIKWLYYLVIGAIVSIIFTFIILSFTKLPTFEDLENPIDTYASDVISSDGRIIGRHFRYNRVQVEYDSLNPYIVKALVATEDERFLKHAGIDFKALGRVLFRTLVLSKSESGGGSTITQQLAKQLFSNRDFSGKNKLSRTLSLIFVKLKEWITAVKLERRYSKQEIIALYLNRCEFVYDAYGIQSAAETFFGKDQKDLDPEEAATLIGMLKNPSYFNPMRRPELTRNRRNVVLSQMRKSKFITKDELDSLKNTELDVSRFKRASHSEGIGRYFLMETRREVERLLDLPENRKPNGEKYNIFIDGLKIYTTLDLTMQEYAESAVMEHMKDVQDRYFKEWKNLDPWTYGADQQQKNFRQRSLRSHIKVSDRYRSIRKNFMDEVALITNGDYENLRFNDEELAVALKAQEDPPTIRKADNLDDDVKKSLENLLKEPYWPEVKEFWKDLEERIEEDFNTPTDMKVFAYGVDGFEKDTVMTPLDSIRYHRMIMQAGVMAMDPVTGHIKVWVGGVNYRYYQYDHIRSNRQVGSTFKPFVYASAIANFGISPCFPIKDVQYTISPGEGRFGLLEPWSPKNSTGEFRNEPIDLYEGLANSVNSVSVYLMKQLGDAEPVRGLLHNMGIDSSARRYDGDYRVPRQPSICLGSPDLSVYEMTAAYSTFANNGVYKRPYFITMIEDRNGKVIYRATDEEIVALPSEANYVMVDLLKGAVGGLRARNLKSAVGGKTGTTNDHVDGWFMGITPGLVVGTWVGGSDRWIRFRSFFNGQGSRMARPIFGKFIEKLEADPTVDYDPDLKFFTPPEPRTIVTDCDQYARFYQSDDEPDVDIDDEFILDEF